MLSAKTAKEITLNKIFHNQLIAVEMEISKVLDSYSNKSYECTMNGELYPDIVEFLREQGYQVNYEIDSEKTIISWR